MECKHCDKAASWLWQDADGNDSAHICQRCMETVSAYMYAPLWQFKPIQGENYRESNLALGDSRE